MKPPRRIGEHIEALDFGMWKTFGRRLGDRFGGPAVAGPCGNVRDEDADGGNEIILIRNTDYADRTFYRRNRIVKSA